MPEITGTLRGVDDTPSSWILTFIPEQTPEVVGSVLAVGLDKRVVLESDGDIPSGTELLGGIYTVEINNGEEFRINVPTGGGPYDIIDLIYSDDDAAPAVTIGVVDPEGVVAGKAGVFYYNTANETLWLKRTGAAGTTTLWQQILG